MKGGLFLLGDSLGWDPTRREKEGQCQWEISRETETLMMKDLEGISYLQITLH